VEGRERHHEALRGGAARTLRRGLSTQQRR
jgi:hypothetical protein